MYNQNNEFYQSEMYETDPEYSGEYYQENENPYGYEEEVFDSEATFDEATQMELASELLSITNEAELDRFLPALIPIAAKVLGGVMGGGGAGAGIGGMLKGIAQNVLPNLLSGFGKRSGKRSEIGAGVFELELEGLSPEDQEFEIAKAFIRFAGNAIKNAITAPQNLPSEEIARRAVVKASRRFAPSLGKFIPIKRPYFLSRNTQNPYMRFRQYPFRYYGSYRKYRPYLGYYGSYRGYYPGMGYDVNLGNNPNTIDNINTSDANGGGISFLTEKINRLEKIVNNLASNLQSASAQNMDAGPVNSPVDKEYYGY